MPTSWRSFRIRTFYGTSCNSPRPCRHSASSMSESVYWEFTHRSRTALRAWAPRTSACILTFCNTLTMFVCCRIVRGVPVTRGVPVARGVPLTRGWKCSRYDVDHVINFCIFHLWRERIIVFRHQLRGVLDHYPRCLEEDITRDHVISF